MSTENTSMGMASVGTAMGDASMGLHQLGMSTGVSIIGNAWLGTRRQGHSGDSSTHPWLQALAAQWQSW